MIQVILIVLVFASVMNLVVSLAIGSFLYRMAQRTKIEENVPVLPSKTVPEQNSGLVDL